MYMVRFQIFPGVALKDDKTKVLLEAILSLMPKIVFCSNIILTIL